MNHKPTMSVYRLFFWAGLSFVCALPMAHAASQPPHPAQPVTPVTATPLPPQAPAVTPVATPVTTPGSASSIAPDVLKSLTTILGARKLSPAGQSLLSLYHPYQSEAARSLTEANRSSQELQTWLSDKVAELMSIDPRTASAKLNASRQFFSADAYNAYLISLGNLPYSDQLRNGQVQINSVVDNMPALISSGPLAGRYVWVFQVGALVNAAPMRSETQLNGPKTLRVNYRIQLARDPNAPPPHNVLLDIWQVRDSASAEPDKKPNAAAPIVVN